MILPIVLLILPSTFFDEGQSICPSKVFLDIECLGCGITRGIQHLIHFEFDLAWQFNKLSIPVLLFAIYFWFLHVFRSYKVIKSFR